MASWMVESSGLLAQSRDDSPKLPSGIAEYSFPVGGNTKVLVCRYSYKA